jgi:lipopolysaccharide transport system ATP-binding protein
MNDIVIKAEDISKLYRLGNVNASSMVDDVKSLWARMRGKEDPILALAQENDRTQKGVSDYVWSLKDINFEVKKGDILGIIGRNGAGKSTLLKILSKVTAPTTGQIKVNGRIASLLEVGTGFHPELTGKENIYLNGHILGMRKKEIDRKFDEIVDFSGVERYIDTPVKRYSSGMYVRLAFGVAAHLESDILIIDEVLAVGDAEFQKKCLGKMQDVSKGEGRTVLFVSHNIGAIKNLCTHGILLVNGNLTFSGAINQAIESYSTTMAAQRAFGKIGSEVKRNKYHKDFMDISSIDVFNSNNFTVEEFSLNEEIIIKITFEVYKQIDATSLACFISDFNGEKVNYSSTKSYKSSDSQSYAPGSYCLSYKLKQNLAPGFYNFTLTFFDSNGYSYDSVLDFGEIKISNFGQNDEHYYWEAKLGNTISYPIFEIQKID